MSWHRRWIAAVLAGLGAFVLVVGLSAPDGAVAPALVTVREVAPGHVLGPGDVALRDVPVASLPATWSVDEDQVLGKTMGVALAANSVVQPGMLAGGTPAGPGRALVPVVVPDERLMGLLAPGTAVVLVQVDADGATVLTSDAVVGATPTQAESSGLVPSSGRAPMLLIDVPSDVAPLVAVLGQRGDLSVVLEGP